MSQAWSVVARALVGGLIVCVGAALLAPLFGQVSLTSVPDHQAEAVSRIELALQQPVDFRFVDMPLVEVMDKVSEKTGVPIYLTRKIEDAGVQPDQPISVTARGISAESFLRLVLKDIHLTTMVCDESVKITTIEDAQSPENMVMRVYPVADLLDYYRLPASEGGAVVADFDSLMNMITSTIEPDSWQDVGGPGGIIGHENSRTLVVTQRRDIHEKLAGTLNTVRQAKRLQAVSYSLPVASASALPMSGGLSALPVRSRNVPKPTPPVTGGCIF